MAHTTPDNEMATHDQEKLIDLLQRWEGLTNAETEAINAEAWARLTTVQQAKDCLQNEIGIVHDRLTLAGAISDSPDWQELVNRLIKRETNNREELTRRRQLVAVERETMQRTGQRLSRLQQAYSTDRGRNWSTYS